MTAPNFHGPREQWDRAGGEHGYDAHQKCGWTSPTGWSRRWRGPDIVGTGSQR